MTKILAPFVFCCLLLYVACIDAPDLPNEPKIVNIGFNVNETIGVFTPETINDSLFIFIEFEDGDGDLGAKEGEPLPFVKIIDNRNGSEDVFEFNNLVVQAGAGSIQGQIAVKYKECCCCGANNGVICLQDDSLPPTDIVTYDIQLVDRAGNESNVFTSPELTLICFP